VIKSLIDGQFLIGVESLLSSLNRENSSRISSSGSSRLPSDYTLNYLLRVQSHYTLRGEPLGALLIQLQALQLFEHVCYVSCPLGEEKPDFLPLKGFKSRFTNLGDSSLNSISEIATSQLESIEASADFLKFKTLPQEDLSLCLKATCIRLACIAFVTEHGNDTNLPTVVKNILIDPAQMSHDDLSSACLDVIAAMSLNCHEHTAELNRSLRSFIINVHRPYSNNTSSRVCIAARRLAWCLSAISKDKIVSTLYSLVNILVSGPSSDRNANSLRPRAALSLMNFDQHTVASSISLTLKSDDQRQQVYSNVIEAIAEMVCELKDEKIAELMISLLGQKFGRVSEGVDKSLVWGLAKISGVVKEKDFRRILKLHAKARMDSTIANPSLIATVYLFHVKLIIDYGCASVYGQKYGGGFSLSGNPPN
jgi:phosphatidylinositol 4-kinase A